MSGAADDADNGGDGDESVCVGDVLEGIVAHQHVWGMVREGMVAHCYLLSTVLVFP